MFGIRPKTIGMTVACIVAAWLSGVTAADACSCVGPMPACQATWMAEAVFVGRVLNIANVDEEPGPRHAFLRSRRVTMEVLEKFRGDELLVPRAGASAIEVFTGSGGGDCGVAFQKGASYLVFANSNRSTPALLQTGMCDRTTELSLAQEDLPYLRSLATSPPRGGRVYGYVELIDQQEAGRAPGSPRLERTRLTNMPVTLTATGGTGAKKKTSTNASGEYEFTGLAPGKYRVDVSLPDIYSVISGGSPFDGEVRDARGCSVVNVFARPTAR